MPVSVFFVRLIGTYCSIKFDETLSKNVKSSLRLSPSNSNNHGKWPGNYPEISHEGLKYSWGAIVECVSHEKAMMLRWINNR